MILVLTSDACPFDATSDPAACPVWVVHDAVATAAAAIPPGTTFYLDQDVTLTFEGPVDVQGTPASPVLFDGWDGARWGAVEFGNDATLGAVTVRGAGTAAAVVFDAFPNGDYSGDVGAYGLVPNYVAIDGPLSRTWPPRSS